MSEIKEVSRKKKGIIEGKTFTSELKNLYFKGRKLLKNSDCNEVIIFQMVNLKLMLFV